MNTHNFEKKKMKIFPLTENLFLVATRCKNVLLCPFLLFELQSNPEKENFHVSFQFPREYLGIK